MSQRGIVVLIGVLAVLGILVWLGQRGENQAATEGAQFLPNLEASLGSVDRVTLVKGGNEKVATIERKPDSWVVAERNDYPADTAELAKNLRALAEAKIVEAKTANPELHGKLGVADVASKDATGIAVTLSANGKDVASVVVGDAQGTKYRYVRRADNPQSYLIDRDPDFQHDTAKWLQPDILDVAGARVQQVTIKHPDGETVAISKLDAAAMNFDVAAIPKGRELMYPGVANVIGNGLRQLKLEDVEPVTDAAPEGGDKPIDVEFKTFDGLVVRATGVKRGNDGWMTFEASFDPDQAARFKKPAADAKAGAEGDTDASKDSAAKLGDSAKAGDAKAGGSSAPANAKAAAADPATEAMQINQRVKGWRYKIAGFQFDQLTRHMKDLLKAPPAA